MGIKKLIGFISIFIALIGISNAANFYISPEYKELTSKCESSIDIMIDSEGENVAAADMVLLFNTGEIQPLCFIPGNFLNIGGGMEVKDNKIKVTSYQYPEYSKGKGKFGTLIFRPFSTTKATTLYFDVKKIGLNATAGDSNISRPGGGDLLNKAGFAKYTFIDGECKKIDESLLKNCKIYDNSGSITTFIREYKEEINSGPNLIISSIRTILLLFIIIAIIRKFITKPQTAEGKN